MHGARIQAWSSGGLTATGSWPSAGKHGAETPGSLEATCLVAGKRVADRGRVWRWRAPGNHGALRRRRAATVATAGAKRPGRGSAVATRLPSRHRPRPYRTAASSRSRGGSAGLGGQRRNTRSQEITDITLRFGIR
jgi:hypothetical protein